MSADRTCARRSRLVAERPVGDPVTRVPGCAWRTTSLGADLDAGSARARCAIACVPLGPVSGEWPVDMSDHGGRGSYTYFELRCLRRVFTFGTAFRSNQLEKAGNAGPGRGGCCWGRCCCGCCAGARFGMIGRSPTCSGSRRRSLLRGVCAGVVRTLLPITVVVPWLPSWRCACHFGGLPSCAFLFSAFSHTSSQTVCVSVSGFPVGDM